MKKKYVPTKWKENTDYFWILTYSFDWQQTKYEFKPENTLFIVQNGEILKILPILLWKNNKN